MASQALASRSRVQTCEPSSRKRAAVAAPIPLAPPVIRTRLSFRPRMLCLDRFAAEEVDELDDQDDDHHQFQYEGTALVEFVDHEAVELFGGLQLLLDQVFVVGHSDF